MLRNKFMSGFQCWWQFFGAWVTGDLTCASCVPGAGWRRWGCRVCICGSGTRDECWKKQTLHIKSAESWVPAAELQFLIPLTVIFENIRVDKEQEKSVMHLRFGCCFFFYENLQKRCYHKPNSFEMRCETIEISVWNTLHLYLRLHKHRKAQLLSLPKSYLLL